MISVTIPTRNRAVLLNAALNSLTVQNLLSKQFEILVIDNGSTDHTAAVVKSHKGTLANLSYYHESEPGLHAGRHRGMLESQGDILVFADDDVEALPTWLVSIQEAFMDPRVAMVGGNNLPLFVKQPPLWLRHLWDLSRYGGGRCLAALSILELPEGVRRLSPYYVWGCNFAIRRETLLQAGGFHPDGMPVELLRFRGDGESHVSRHVHDSGLKCLFHSGASVYHKVTPERMTHMYFRQRGFSQGISDSYTQLRSQDNRPTGQRSLPYRAARWSWRKLKEVHARVRLEPDSLRAINELRSGHVEGFAYHQNAYRTDPEVRDWVRRARYF